jgi:hypothetical protein
MNLAKLKGPGKKCKFYGVCKKCKNYGNVRAGFYCIYSVVCKHNGNILKDNKIFCSHLSDIILNLKFAVIHQQAYKSRVLNTWPTCCMRPFGVF